MSRFASLFRRGETERTEADPAGEQRRWQLLQIESTIDCRLECVMCPWPEVRREAAGTEHMRREVWEAIRPHLPQVRSIDFSGGGEPILQPALSEWVAEAKAAGCRTGFLTNAFLLDGDVAARLLDAGLDWIAFSIDGATKQTYEAIRIGSDFERVRDNVARLTRLRRDGLPRTMINVVLMPINFHEVEGMVRLAADLGVDKVNFKQCDVVRGEHGKGLGLFAASSDQDVRRLEKTLGRARNLARKLGVATGAFEFLPRELPVCEQDPRSSLFIRHDGRVAACIGLAYGGPAVFLGRDVVMPTKHYGRLPEDDLLAIWEGAPCRARRTCFEERTAAHDRRIMESFVGSAPSRFQPTLDAAIKAMPEAPEGCRICHYLHGV